jgi:hypothetical protein
LPFKTGALNHSATHPSLICAIEAIAAGKLKLAIRQLVEF